MRMSLTPDTSLDIDQYELGKKVREVASTKKYTDNLISHQIATFDSNLLKNIQHLLSEHLMSRGIRRGLKELRTDIRCFHIYKNIPSQKMPTRHKDANSILVEIGFLSRRKKLKTKLSEYQTPMVSKNKVDQQDNNNKHAR